MFNEVSITDAKIGETMILNYTLAISEILGSNPTLKVTMRKQNGDKIGCIRNIGSCNYKLCGGTSSVEQDLARQWNNQCPVPVITAQQSIVAKLYPIVQYFIGYAPTTIGIDLEATNGGTTVGCQSFKVNIAAA
ncbi:uncharacterized protein LOC144105534 [Amblyomma americanum]